MQRARKLGNLKNDRRHFYDRFDFYGYFVVRLHAYAA